MNVEQRDARRTAVVRRRTSWAAFPSEWKPMLDEVYAVDRGPYGQLGSTHDAINKWCTREGLTLAGPRWEIYGDCTDDESALETEIVYLLL